QKILFGDTAIFENDRRCVARAQSEFIFFLTRCEAGHSFFKNECRDAVMTGCLVGDSHCDADVAIRAVSGEGLLAVQDPMIAIQPRYGLSSAGVTSGFGVGKTTRSQSLAFGERHGDVAA